MGKFTKVREGNSFGRFLASRKFDVCVGVTITEEDRFQHQTAQEEIEKTVSQFDRDIPMPRYV